MPSLGSLPRGKQDHQLPWPPASFLTQKCLAVKGEKTAEAAAILFYMGSPSFSCSGSAGSSSAAFGGPKSPGKLLLSSPEVQLCIKMLNWGPSSVHRMHCRKLLDSLQGSFQH